MLQDSTIKQIVPEELYQKYQRFVNRIQMNLDPLRKWCPNPICAQVIILNEENPKKGKCEQCGLEICGKCGQDHHETISCEQVIILSTKALTIFGIVLSTLLWR